MPKLFYSSRTCELVNKTPSKQNTIINLGKNKLGSKQIIVMAGPCTVESNAQIKKIGAFIKSEGAHVLRGGAYKPCTFPYRFKGHEEAGLKWLREVSDKNGVPFITEVMDTRDVALVEKYTDIIQIGTRNMQNYRLLTEVGKTRKPVFLKRGTWATLDEFLGSAEYILKEGNKEVILCERGIVSLETHTRWTLSLASVPTLKNMTHLPVVVDPSHGTGRRELVIPMAKAAIACGADGLMIEVHYSPDKSVSDAIQTINFKDFSRLMKEIEPVARAVKRHVKKPVTSAASLGLVASRFMKKNTKITKTMLTKSKSSDGISPRLSSSIIGKRTLYDIKEGEPITFGVVKI